MKIKSEFRRNVLTLMGGTTVAQAIPIVITPILTRLYTPEDFGLFALFIAMVGVFSTIVSLRYEQAILLPQKGEDAINMLALGFLIIVAISLFLLFFILIFHNAIAALFKNDAISIWLYFIPLTTFFIGLFNLLSYFNNREKKYKDIAKATIVKSIVLATIQLSVGFLKSGVSGLISAQIVAQFFANLQLLKNVLKNRELLTALSKERIIALAVEYREFPKYQAPHALFSNVASNLPIYFFTTYFNAMVVGYYSLALRMVVSPMMLVSNATAKVYNQKLASLYQEKGDIYNFTRQLFQELLKKITLLFLLFIFFMPDIFTYLFGDNWRVAGVYTQILSPSIFLLFFASIIAYTTSLLGLQKRALILDIIYFVLKLSALAVGAYIFDIIGALIAYSFVSSVSYLYSIFWLLNELKRAS